MKSLLIGFLCAGACFAPRKMSADDTWPQFRGPRGDGHASAGNLPVHWSEDTNVAWKSPLPGRGWSSPVVADKQIWLTTGQGLQADEETRKRRTEEMEIPDAEVFSSLTLQAICLDRQSGELLHVIDLFQVDDPPLIHPTNSYASPTPVIDGQNVFFHFGTFGTACVDRRTGEVRWRNSELNVDHEAGPGSSPIVWRDKLIVHFDGCDQQFVVALNTADGRVSWKTPRSGTLHPDPSFKKAFCTPIIVNRRGSDQLISPGANWVYAYDPQSGKELWKAEYGELGFSNVAMPLVKGDLLYVCTCFGSSRLLALRLGTGPERPPTVSWTYYQQVPNISSPAIVDEHLYMVSDRGIATCLDADVGIKLWHTRLGGEFSASPIYADGLLYFCNSDGQTFVVRPGEMFDLVATNSLDAGIMASPAIVGRELYIRTEKSLYRLERLD